MAEVRGKLRIINPICVAKTFKKCQYSINIALAFKTAVIIVTAVFYDNPVIIEYNNEARNIKDIF
ncbi:hypothetical protein A9Z61_04070 [Moraxella osloensis]|nr:hypothetical protein A9Z61_04070 [Moraxella osloensis]